jgi:DNA polymerase I-like protein with 3'-5' exonuclease and polymerase domains
VRAPPPLGKPWPIPAQRRISQPTEAQTLAAELLQLRPPAIALFLALDDAPDLPVNARTDPHRARPAALALAAPGLPAVHLLQGPALADLSPFQALLGAHIAPPYVVVHDAHRTLGVLARRGLTPRRVGCTLTAATLLAEGADDRRDDRPLSALVRAELAHDLPGEIDRGLIRSELGVNHQDAAAAAADALLPLMRAYAPRLRERHLVRVFELECELVPAVLDMEATGLAVDAPAFARIVESWRRERLTAEEPARITRLDKLLTTYGNWPRDYVSAGRIRTHLYPLATDSGRFACADPNLQQVPSEHTAPGVRACFVAPPGARLIIADYAQIELRVAAHLAPCPVLRQVFRDRRDPHRTTAAALTRAPESAVTDHQRKLAKAVNFGFLFGMGARRFREYAAASYGLDLDLPAAERAREAFFRAFPGIAAWHRRIGDLSRRGEREDITVQTALGRRKRFPAGAFAFNAALNIPVQGTAAEGFKRAMIDLHRGLAPLGGRGVLCVHDEYLAEVPEDRAEEARQLVTRIMEEAMATIVPSVPIVAEARIATSWAG